MDALARDIRHAARVLARHRTFTLTALVILFDVMRLRGGRFRGRLDAAGAPRAVMMNETLAREGAISRFAAAPA